MAGREQTYIGCYKLGETEFDFYRKTDESLWDILTGKGHELINHFTPNQITPNTLVSESKENGGRESN